MAKKFTGIRLDDETISFLSKEAIRNGIHHKLSSEIPNITGIIEEILTIHKKMSEKGISLSHLKQETFIDQIGAIKTTHNS